MTLISSQGTEYVAQIKANHQLKTPRYLYLDTTSISKPWRVVIKHEFECAGFLFVNISLDILDLEQVLNRSVFTELNQIKDDSGPDPVSMQKSKSPYHQRISENLNVQGYSQYY